jgi:protein-disulfide isomerase
MRYLKVAAGVVVLSAALVAVVSAQQSTSEIEQLRKDVESLKARQQALENQLAQLIAALTQGRDQQEATVNVKGAPSLGKPDAKVTMVEFSDFQCPFCGRHFSQTMPQIEKNYIDTGKVRYVFRDFPIESLHPQSPKAHEAVNCAGDQGKYWEMWQRLFTHQRQMAHDDLVADAVALALDKVKFTQCLDSGKYTQEVQTSVNEAMRLGANGTPTIFLGLTEPGSDTLKATRVIRGAHPYDRFKETIDSLLATK